MQPRDIDIDGDIDEYKEYRNPDRYANILAPNRPRLFRVASKRRTLWYINSFIYFDHGYTQ